MLASLLLVTVIALATTAAAQGAGTAAQFRFGFRRSSTASTCLPNATARAVLDINGGNTETLTVILDGAPANKEFDVFIIQVPKAPFGVSWYQGDISTDSSGHGSVAYRGRFSIETFAVAPGVAPAPVVHEDIDASTNPAFNPIHMYHVGIWFNSPADSVAAGCANVTTPFNGDHTAGPQAFNTRNFPNNAGPLKH